MRKMHQAKLLSLSHDFVIAAFFVICTAPITQASQITVSGYVYGTWEADTVLVTGDIQLPPDNVLTINAGTKVLFDGNWQFRIDEYAQITAMGTPTKRIYFKPLRDGETWRGIRMDFCCGLSIFDYCFFSDAAIAGIGDSASGGAIHLNKSNLAIYHCVFEGCKAGSGGAIFCGDHSDPLITDCIFSADSAGFGGAISVADSSSPLIQSCYFLSNRAEHEGGAIYSSKSSPIISQNQFQGNAGNYGCIRIWQPDTTLPIEGNMFQYDSSKSVIHISDMGPWSAVIRNNTINNSEGVAIFAEIASPRIEGNAISHNGAGMDFEYSASRVVCNLIMDNNGCAITTYDDFNAVQISPTFEHNIVDRNRGGGINAAGGEPVIRHNYITRNQGKRIGGIRLTDCAATIEHNTVAANIADSAVGGIIALGASPVLRHCIVYGNGPLAQQVSTDLSPDLPADSCDIQGGWVYGSGNIDIDPLFRDTAHGDFFATSGAITTLPLASCGNGIPDSMEIWINPNATSVNDPDRLNLPSDFTLSQNYPNPFNPSTTIAFALPYHSHIRLEIFNTVGQLVRTLCDTDLPAGPARVIWDGRDQRGDAASSGVYFYRLKSDNRTIARKMLLLK